MADPYIGEIRMFGGNFAPVGWAFCSGQVLPISENDALFNLVGTTYGGDGVTTFAVPDLRGRVPLHQGGAPYVLGQSAGTEYVTLTTATMAAHSHPVSTTGQLGTANTPANNLLADEGPANVTSPFAYGPTDSGNQVAMRPALSPTGGSQQHENRQPYLAVNFIISLFGIYPAQS